MPMSTSRGRTSGSSPGPPRGGAGRGFSPCAYAWPGWAGAGKTEPAALETLAAYGPRYALVAAVAGMEFDAAARLRGVERLPGDASPAFGVPAQVTTADLEEPPEGEKERLLSLLGACWEVFDEVAAAAPEALRKGP